MKTGSCGTSSTTTPASRRRHAGHQLRTMSLRSLLEKAARGSFPLDDGQVAVLPPPAGPCDAVVALTGYSVVAAGVSERWVADRVPRDDFTGPMRPDFIADLADELGATPGSGLVNLGRGLDGRLELSIELLPGKRCEGRGRRLIEAARALVSPDDLLFASVAPGNARCLRAALAGGFTPIGSEVLFLVRPSSGGQAI